MFYNCAELEDGTQVAFSSVLDGGEVEVSVERPVEPGFDAAMCALPSFKQSIIEGFNKDEMSYLDSFVRNNASATF